MYNCGFNCNPLAVFLKKAVLKNLAKLTEKCMR